MLCVVRFLLSSLVVFQLAFCCCSQFGKDFIPSMTGKKLNRFSPAIIQHRYSGRRRIEYYFHFHNDGICLFVQRITRLNEFLYHICSNQNLRDSEVMAISSHISHIPRLTILLSVIPNYYFVFFVMRISQIFRRFLSVDNNVRLAFNTGDFADEDGDRNSS